MSEYIEREAAIDSLSADNIVRNLDSVNDGSTNRYHRAAQRVIASLPAADVRPVVLCKDCKWYEIDELKKDGTEDRRYKPSVCVLAGQRREPNHFCADGKKREES